MIAEMRPAAPRKRVRAGRAAEEGCVGVCLTEGACWAARVHDPWELIDVAAVRDYRVLLCQVRRWKSWPPRGLETWRRELRLFARQLHYSCIVELWLLDVEGVFTRERISVRDP